jgi:hypothetical protein
MRRYAVDFEIEKTSRTGSLHADQRRNRRFQLII